MHVTLLAANKVRELAKVLESEEMSLRVMVVGGGCSGFAYDMDFVDNANPGDWELELEGLSIVVDPIGIPLRKSERQEHMRLRVKFCSLRRKDR